MLAKAEHKWSLGYTMQHGLAIAILVSVGAVVVWDVYASARGEIASTVSAIISRWSSNYPILPLAVGVVLGHLFWPTVVPAVKTGHMVNSGFGTE